MYAKTRWRGYRSRSRVNGLQVSGSSTTPQCTDRDCARPCSKSPSYRPPDYRPTRSTWPRILCDGSLILNNRSHFRTKYLSRMLCQPWTLHWVFLKIEREIFIFEFRPCFSLYRQRLLLCLVYCRWYWKGASLYFPKIISRARKFMSTALFVCFWQETAIIL